MKYLSKLTKKLKSAPLNIDQYNDLLESNDTFFESTELETELLVSNGYPLFFNHDKVYLKTKLVPISEQVFCIVDIETTGGNPNKGQLLEIAAVKLKGGMIIEKYQSLVNCHEIPPKVQELTGISLEMVENAPNLKSVLEEFKIFLEDDVFVAHNLSFDYKFISDSFEKYNLGQLYNRGLCTINLCHRTIEAERYGLKYITEHLGIEMDEHHRAMSDTMATAEVFKRSLENIPGSVVTPEDLISFSLSKKEAKVEKKAP